MKAPIFVIGLGQLGVAFSEGFLKLGYPVVPILRGESLDSALSHHRTPELILVAVGEDDLAQVLEQVPEELHDSLVLVQNELRPATWMPYLSNVLPSVVIVWFEKKQGSVAQVVLPSVVFGAKRELCMAALNKMQLPAREIASASDLSHELAVKNLYILGLNLAGLVTQGQAGELLGEHSDFFATITNELTELEQAALMSSPQSAFSQITLNCSALQSDLRAAILADPAHGCKGRSAPRRLARTLALASELSVSVPHIAALSDIAAPQSQLP